MTLVATQVKRRRGTNAENDAFAGAEGEITVDLTNKELRVHDGSGKTGGFRIGRHTDRSNCITEIPQDIKLEFDTTTKILTLKAGSKLYIPNGSGVFNEITINSDQTLTNTFGGQYDTIFVCWDSANNVMRQTPTGNSGTSDPSTAPNRIWYDITANKIKYYENAGTTVTSDSLSLPICIMQNAGSGDGFTKIQQVFNGFGYIGSTTFVLPGVKGLAPNGRNPDGTYNNTEFNFITPSVHALDYSNEVSKNCFLTDNGVFGYSANYYEQDTKPVFSGIYATWFDIKNNIIKWTTDGGTTWVQNPRVYLGVLLKNANANITSLIPKQAFRAVDYNDTDRFALSSLSNLTSTGKANAAKLAMPDYSSAYSVSAGSAGNQNTATTNGFIVFSSTSSNQDRQLIIDNQQTAYTYTSQIGCVVPIAKGSTWYFIGAYVFLKFVPCKEVY